MRYIERNPVRAGLLEQPWAYPWSSAQAHVSGIDRHAILVMADWASPARRDAWKAFIASVESEKLLAGLRKQL
jgi:putative transposase